MIGTDPSSYDAWFNGDVDKVAIYSEPLTHVTVFNMYKGGRARTTTKAPSPPTDAPSSRPSASPSTSPTSSPTPSPSAGPSPSPTSNPTPSPSDRPSASPSSSPTTGPTSSPSVSPSAPPSGSPTSSPTDPPTPLPTLAPVAATAQCLRSDPTECGCSQVKQADYRGTTSVTVSGRQCQRWDDHTTHSHTHLTAETKPYDDLVENYCRNPDGEPRAWCYTTDPNRRWEVCGVPFCPAVCQADPAECGCSSVRQADYRGTVSTTASGIPCVTWGDHSLHPHGHNDPAIKPDAGLESNYCRNPDGEPRAWCYTTDPNVRWDYCSVPSCVEG
mmetsp:Transcript_56550/g.169130  ORF Transcript_56550/g.169130 Transcript_56550/m.169130 type:complete len:329 (+) Transcript_56550:466-1452(+)